MDQTLAEMRQDAHPEKLLKNIWMIPRSIWRWMILDIKRKTKENESAARRSARNLWL